MPTSENDMPTSKMDGELTLKDQYDLDNISLHCEELLDPCFDLPGIGISSTNSEGEYPNAHVDLNKESAIKLRDWLSYWIEQWPQR